MPGTGLNLGHCCARCRVTTIAIFPHWYDDAANNLAARQGTSSAAAKASFLDPYMHDIVNAVPWSRLYYRWDLDDLMARTWGANLALSTSTWVAPQYLDAMYVGSGHARVDAYSGSSSQNDPATQAYWDWWHNGGGYYIPTPGTSDHDALMTFLGAGGTVILELPDLYTQDGPNFQHASFDCTGLINRINSFLVSIGSSAVVAHPVDSGLGEWYRMHPFILRQDTSVGTPRRGVNASNRYPYFPNTIQRNQLAASIETLSEVQDELAWPQYAWQTKTVRSGQGSLVTEGLIGLTTQQLCPPALSIPDQWVTNWGVLGHASNSPIRYPLAAHERLSTGGRLVIGYRGTSGTFVSGGQVLGATSLQTSHLTNWRISKMSTECRLHRHSVLGFGTFLPDDGEDIDGVEDRWAAGYEAISYGGNTTLPGNWRYFNPHWGDMAEASTTASVKVDQGADGHAYPLAVAELGTGSLLTDTIWYRRQLNGGCDLQVQVPVMPTDPDTPAQHPGFTIYHRTCPEIFVPSLLNNLPWPDINFDVVGSPPNRSPRARTPYSNVSDMASQDYTDNPLARTPPVTPVDKSYYAALWSLITPYYSAGSELLMTDATYNDITAWFAGTYTGSDSTIIGYIWGLINLTASNEMGRDDPLAFDWQGILTNCAVFPYKEQRLGGGNSVRTSMASTITTHIMQGGNIWSFDKPTDSSITLGPYLDQVDSRVRYYPFADFVADDNSDLQYSLVGGLPMLWYQTMHTGPLEWGYLYYFRLNRLADDILQATPPHLYESTYGTYPLGGNLSDGPLGLPAPPPP